MKRKFQHRRWYQIRQEVRRRRLELRAVTRRKLLLPQRRTQDAIRRSYLELRRPRAELKQILYQKKAYTGPRIAIKIEGEFGIEEQRGIKPFLDLAASFIDFNASEISFDLTNCTRMWPTAITLLCSLMRWVELTRAQNFRPRLSSTPSTDKRVNSYLGHCGFYDYVHRAKDTDEDYYSNDDIVKIRREITASSIEERESEIINVLKTFSSLGTEDLERFDAKVLTEVFNNITEHGVNLEDQGWWVLAQSHPTHKLISLCFADNGIGIRNSLMTGPQREDIGRKIANEPSNDGTFIKLAIEETVSGAFEAPVMEAGWFRRSYPPGARRGHGLKIIRSTCAQLGIPFSILSHHGYAFMDSSGTIADIGSTKSRVFAGTMYQFTIMTK